MKGLEISEVNFSNLERTLRIDPEFYKKENLRALDILLHRNPKPITKFVSVSDGNHMSISDYFTSEDGLPYYRGQDIYNFFIEQSEFPLKIEERAFNFPYLTRSHLKKGDVLLSIVGAIIGNLSLVKTDQKATCSCKLAIMRPKSIEPEFLAIFLRSRYGQNQIQKFRRGTAQTGLILEDFDQLVIPEFGAEFRETIALLVEEAFNLLEISKQTYQQAEFLLFDSINLNNFEPVEENINVKKFSESFLLSGRLDAQYYQLKYEQLVNHLMTQKHDFLKNIVDIKKSIEPGSDNYSDDEGLPFMRVSDYSKFGIHEPQKKLTIEFCKENIELINMLKPKKETILFSKDGTVGIAYMLQEDQNVITSGAILHLTVKDKEYVMPEYLTLVLNSQLVKMQSERDAGGSIILHWRVSEIENVVIPVISYSLQEEISSMVSRSFSLKSQSDDLLHLCIRTVELAIEHDEVTAINYLTKAKENIVG